MYNNSTHTLTHPILGRLKGLVSSKTQTTQYRNIKYATIPGRWQDPILFSQKHEVEFDATKVGPSCPQHPAGFLFDLSLVGKVKLDREKGAEEVNEFECLHLVITVPEGVDMRKRLPVMVCVHGGGFSVGSNSWPQYDLSNLVQNSVEINRPVIAVSMNYRLGPFGFLASDELGITGNYGLKDQICAFKWIQQNISGFGGDPNNITAFGESAGSICLSTLLHTHPSTPLFNRCILMSGDPTLRRPRDMTWQNNHYLSISHSLQLTRLSPHENKQYYFNTPAQELAEKLPAFRHWSPVIDGELIKGEVTVGMLSDAGDGRGKPGWCGEVLVGDVAHDGSILANRLLDDPTALQRLHTSLAYTLNAYEAEKVLYAYNLYGEPDKDRIYKGLMDLGSDLRFHLPMVKLAEGWGKRGLRYHFHQLNPIEGKWKGYASHELDIAYLLGNYDEFLSAGDRKLGKEMAGFWIGFANGEGLSGSEEGELLVIGPGEEMRFVGVEEYDAKYRKGRGKLWEEIGWEKWFRLGELLQGC